MATPDTESVIASRDLSALRIQRDSWEPPRRRRMPAWLVATVVVLGVAAVGFRLLLRTALEVSVSPALMERPASGASGILTASGYVVPRTKASISAKMAGRLQELRVGEGDVVREGDILGVIEHRDLAAQRRAADAELEEARARLAHAKALRDQAVRDLARQRQLLVDGVVTQAAYDQAEAVARTSEAAVVEAEAVIRTAEARLSQAEIALDDAQVRAPFTGTILRKEADVGESVAPAVASGQTTRGAIVTMADLTLLDVEADVSESNIARVTLAQPAEVALDAVADRRYKGRVRQILPTADRDKATVKVKVAIEEPDDSVKPEMSAKVTFLSGEPDAEALRKPPVITAPREAIVVDGAKAFAWVVQEGLARRREVLLGEERGSRVVVVSGLAEGDSLIVNPPPALQDGAKVKVKS